MKYFGATGDGLTNDHPGFEAAAVFFNERKGNGKLTIPSGKYIVGRQVRGDGISSEAYTGFNVLHFKDCKNLTIQFEAGAVIKYADGLKFGAFDPFTGEPYLHGDNFFADWRYVARIGHCLFLEDCENINVFGLMADGNNINIDKGGVYGDTGIQIPHYGILVQGGKNIKVDGFNIHHFGEDGIGIGSYSQEPFNIQILNGRSEYNGRLGISWIGGNGLFVKNCKFNHTGRAAIFSMPGSGIDIEAELGPFNKDGSYGPGKIRNGVFEDCEFVNNTIIGMVADSGDTANCIFKRSTFHGTTSWSAWVSKAGFKFYECNFYGGFVHGYHLSKNSDEGTQFYKCHFEDILYNGVRSFGRFLVESNNAKYMVFEDCTFVANKCRLMWLGGSGLPDEQKYLLRRCKLIFKSGNIPEDNWIASLGGVRFEDVEIIFEDGELGKGYYISKSNNVGTYKTTYLKLQK